MMNREDKMNKEYNTGSRILFIFIFLMLITIAAVIIYPLLWMIITGFKTNKELFLKTWSLPEKFIWSNYKPAWA